MSDYGIEFFTAVVPPIYRKASISDFGNGLQGKIDDLLNGSSALIFGDNGVGKTHLAWALLKEMVSMGKSVRYTKAQLLLYEIKSKDDPYRFCEKEYGRQNCLVIDEIDKIFESKADFIYLNYLVDYRYEWMRQTIVMGNGDKDRFTASLGQSIYSRLNGRNGMDIVLSGTDKRMA